LARFEAAGSGGEVNSVGASVVANALVVTFPLVGTAHCYSAAIEPPTPAPVVIGLRSYIDTYIERSAA
jgi:hypothetical protein